MSVSIIADAELAGLHVRLGSGRELAASIYALALANRAAYVMSYSTLDGASPVPDLSATPAGPPVSSWSTREWAANLLYNCLANDGRDFAPAADRQRVLAAAAQVDGRRPGVA